MPLAVVVPPPVTSGFRIRPELSSAPELSPDAGPASPTWDEVWAQRPNLRLTFGPVTDDGTNLARRRSNRPGRCTRRSLGQGVAETS